MKRIIVDLDGTLFQTDLVILKAIEKACEEGNINVPSKEEIRASIGLPSEKFYQKLNISSIKEKVKEYEKEYLTESNLYDYTKEVLRELNLLGYECVLVSNGSKAYIESILNQFQIKNYFKHIVSKEDNKTKKDHIKEMKTDFTLVCGDQQEEIEAGLEIGAITIGALYGYGDVRQADYHIKSLYELTDLLYRLDLYYKIEKSITFKDKAFLVGINGVDTSGKTTFTKELSFYLKKRGFHVQCIHLDDFHHPSIIRKQGYFEHAFNLEGLEEDLLKDLSKGHPIHKTLTLLDLDTDEYSNKKDYHIERNTIVLLEGVLLYRESIEDYFDYKIYLDISFDEVLRRAEIRDVPLYGIEFLDRYKQKYIPIQKMYIETYKPKEKCDLLIDNTHYKRPREVIMFETERLILSPFDEKDTDFLFELNNNVLVNMYLSFDHYTLEQCEHSIKEWYLKYHHNQLFNVYKVILKETHEKIGLVFLVKLKEEEAEVGYRFLPDFWHKGYAKEAVQYIINKAFHEFQMKRIMAETHPGNDQSVHFLLKSGFKELKNHGMHEGRIFYLENKERN